MSQKDTVHHAVKNALVKDGWTILADPYTIVNGRTQLYADLCLSYPLLLILYPLPTRTPSRPHRERFGSNQ